MKTTFIYALCEPATRLVRYIGKTNEPKKRLRRHLSVSARLETHLGHWLKSLSTPPEFVTLKEVPLSDWKIEETRFINLATQMGYRLVNATSGGEGLQDPSPETRRKLREAAAGRKMSPEARAKMSAFAKTRSRPQSPETKEKIRRSLLGRKHSQESRDRMSAALRGPNHPRFGKKHSSETKEKIRRAALLWRNS